ncbi:MAG TPA: NosD domain-containing protein, partial [Nitriliruptorales bacterium]
LWPVAVGVAVLAAGIAALTRRRWLRRVGLVWVCLTPLGVLADIQFRLYQYGHDLNPLAALRIDEFTPLVIGPTKVWNFTTWARPGNGLLLIAAAALLLTVAPWAARRWRASRASRGVVTAALAVLVLVLAPTVALADGGREYGGGHEHGGGGEPPVKVPEPDQPVLPATDMPEITADADLAGAELAERLAGALPGQTIVLEPRSYRGSFVIDVPVTLDGGGGAMLVTTGSGSTLTIRAPGTTVRGLHVHGSGPGPTETPCGIRIEADDVTIESTLVHDAYIGIGVASATGTHLVANHVVGREDATIASDAHAVADDPAGHTRHAGTAGHGSLTTARNQRGDAISLWDARGALIRDNVLESARDGILLSFGSGALIDRNTIRDGRYAVHSMYAKDLTIVSNTVQDNMSGLVLMYGGPALVLRNHVSDSLSLSTGFGLLLKDVVDAQVSGNLLAGNRVAIHVDGPTGTSGPGTRFTANTITSNQVGVALYPSARSVFRGNSFHENLVQVLAKGRGVADRNLWSDRGLGNYWSTYR